MSRSNFMDKFHQAYGADGENGEELVSFMLPGAGIEVKLKPFSSGPQKDVMKALERKDILKADSEMDKIIKACVTGIKHDELMSADRHALIIKLRQITLGSEFEYTSICKNEDCDTHNALNLTLDDFELVSLDAPPAEEELVINENLSFMLGHTIRQDEVDLSAYAKATSSNTKGKPRKELDSEEVYGTELRYATYAITIKKVVFKKDGEVVETLSPSFRDRIAMLNDLSNPDSDKIEDFIKRQKTFGYDMTVDVDCSECGHRYEESIEWIALFVK